MHHSKQSAASIFACAMLFAAGTFANAVHAQDVYWIADDVSLTNLRVSHSRSGGQTQITFLLENYSAERILFKGLEIAGSSDSRIAASLGNGLVTSLDSIPVAPSEVLPIDGGGLWIEVEGLSRKLRAGGMIKATVHFGEAAIPVDLTLDDKTGPSF